MSLVCLLTIPKYGPGDPKPEGYLQQHEWARMQLYHRIKQKRCKRCKRYFFPQENHTLDTCDGTRPPIENLKRKRHED